MSIENNKDLVILNGPTRGLGLALVSQLVKEDKYCIICLVRDLSRIRDLSKFQNSIQIIQCDYSNLSEVNINDGSFAAIFNRQFRNVYFVNNLSVLNPVGKIGSLKNLDIQNNIIINLLSCIMIINSFLKYARAEKFVSILNISSGISQKPVAGLGLYGLSKSCAEYLLEVISKENKGNRIRVSSFYPGGMKTDMQSILQKELSENIELREFDYSRIFNQELQETKKIAEVIFANFLQSDTGWEKVISKIYEYN